MLVLSLTINWLLLLLLAGSGGKARVTVPYSYFTQQVQAGNVATVNARGASIQGTFRHAITYPAQSGTKSTDFGTERPAFADDHLLSELTADGAVISAKPTSYGQPLWVTLVGGVLPTILLIWFWIWVIRRWSQNMQAGGGMFGMGQSKAHKYEASAQRTTFADVAGIDEATEELQEVVDFLKHPDRYRRLGGQIPRGVLLSGQPGTGKTLLARAVAGEAEVPFYSISASEFVEMIVGVGASRVRDLFEQAKSDAPSIIFIDELDAIGRSRSSGAMSGANDEREQTLNQILTEMDGFTGNEGVIVLAATNRPEVLDSALLRPGRFDRRITINPPDQQGRLKILQVHTRSVPLEDPSVLETIAATTPGMVGADLKNLVNEAALTAGGESRRRQPPGLHRRARADHARRRAPDRDLSGGAASHRLPRVRPRLARHAATRRGPHSKDLDHPPRTRPRSDLPEPRSDRYGYGENYLRGRLIGMLGGRAAELLIYGETATGPESDLEQATSLARQMVGRWGMSEEIGAVSALPRQGEETYGSIRHFLPAHVRDRRRGSQEDHQRLCRASQTDPGRAPHPTRPSGRDAAAA